MEPDGERGPASHGAPSASCCPKEKIRLRGRLKIVVLMLRMERGLPGYHLENWFTRLQQACLNLF